MSRYPCDFYTEVNIDAYQMVDYVRENWEYFCEEIGDKRASVEVITETIKQIENTINKFDYVRRFRDSSVENRDNDAVKLYNAIEQIKQQLEKAL